MFCAPPSTPPMWGQLIGATACGRGVARSLPSHVQRRPRSGVGEELYHRCVEKQAEQSTFATRVPVTEPQFCGGTKTCRIWPCLLTRPCKWQQEGTVRILLLREDAGAERARLLSLPYRFVVSDVM